VRGANIATQQGVDHVKASRDKKNVKGFRQVDPGFVPKADLR